MEGKKRRAVEWRLFLRVTFEDVFKGLSVIRCFYLVLPVLQLCIELNDSDTNLTNTPAFNAMCESNRLRSSSFTSVAVRVTVDFSPNRFKALNVSFI